MGNLDWGSKFSLDMSPNMGEGKRSTLKREIILLLTNKSTFLMELTKRWENIFKKNAFLKSLNFYKHKIHNFDF